MRCARPSRNSVRHDHSRSHLHIHIHTSSAECRNGRSCVRRSHEIDAKIAISWHDHSRSQLLIHIVTKRRMPAIKNLNPGGRLCASCLQFLQTPQCATTSSPCPRHHLLCSMPLSTSRASRVSHTMLEPLDEDVNFLTLKTLNRSEPVLGKYNLWIFSKYTCIRRKLGISKVWKGTVSE